MNTTQIKDGLILLVIAGVAIGGYLVARRVIDGVGSIGQGVGEALTNAKEAIAQTAKTAVEPIKPTIPQNAMPALTDYERQMLENMAAGGMGA
jgi:predicted RNase H-like HicB family nuclease